MHPSAESTTEIAFSESEPAVPNGAWTWFTDERAIVDADAGEDDPRILVGSVSAGDGSDAGAIDVLWYDVGNDDTGHTRLHGALEQDDHNVPALFVRPDGCYLAMYAKHGSDPYTRWRVSTDPHDPTRWEPERTLDNGAGTTYCNVYYLPDDAGEDGRTYCFTRTDNWDPNVLVSTDTGSTWTRGGRLLSRGGDDRRPYVRYCRGDDRIHVTATDDHPLVHENGVYHGSVRDGRLSDSAGRVVADSVIDGGGTASSPAGLTRVFAPGTVIEGTRMTRAWTVDASVDEEGRPVAVFQARAEDDPSDHRFFYARFDGDGWLVHHLARAGPGLYDGEPDYTGLAAIDPGDAGRIVVSTSVDPRGGGVLDHHELFAGATDDRGATWEWTPLTPGASADNLRPLLPAWDGDRTALLWMRGPYHSYERWETHVVGRVGRWP